jgi:hypothetical protein
MLGHSIVPQHFMEPEGSIPNSQELATCSYPEPDHSSPPHPIPPLQDQTSSIPCTKSRIHICCLGCLSEKNPSRSEAL